ncbi:MAG: DUF1659 domain-containing protein [Peptococcaceae bacterium]|nr:DUF1659 domain-containing protein [Peptococcaceae bacterium]
MAIITTPLDSTFVARYQIDTSGSGAPITRQKTFSGVKATASSEDIYEVASALFNLLQYPLLEVRRDDRFALTEE